MAINGDTYYDRPEVSNSDLTALKKYWMPQTLIIDLEAAYRFGTLIDLLITEPGKIDYFKLTAAGEKYSTEEFEKAIRMKKVFFADPFCRSLILQCQMQKISVKHGFPINYEGFDFSIDVRCKWDFFAPAIDLCADLKSTACTTLKQFEESIYHFDYTRQAAYYMDIENKSNFMFIGISKINYKIFKVPVKRGGQIYKEGKAKYQELAFKYWYLFGNVNPLPVIIAEFDPELNAVMVSNG